MKITIARVVLGLVALAYCVFFPGGLRDSHTSNVLAAAVDFKSTDRASRDKVIQGELKIVIEDGKSDWRTLYYLKTTEGKTLSLHFAKEPPQNLQTGMKVNVQGVLNGSDLNADDLVAQDLSSSSALTTAQTTAATLSNTTGEHKVLVILVNFQDLQTQPYTVAEAQDVAFNQTSNFYRENSYGQTWLTGDVYGWYTIPVSSTNCDTTAIATYAQQAASRAGANLSAYNHYVYAFPQTSACGFTGQGTIDGSPSEAWISGWFEVGSVGHELGHNFGLYHSRAMDCGTAVIGSNCTNIEYGDVFDIMGSGSTTHFNPYQKERLGWLNNVGSPPIQTVTSSGTYWIDAYETPGSAAKAIKILKSTDPTTGKKTWYYLDHRTPTGFDSYLSSWGAQANGIGLRTGSEVNPQDTYLLDTTATDSWNDAMLIAGQSFTDPAAGLTITTVSADGTGAWVQISLNAQPCTHANPTVTVSPGQTQWLRSGSTFNYSVTVTNNEGSGCSTGSFNLAANAPAGWSASYSAISLSIAPGGSASASLSVTSPVGTPDGTYNVSAGAANGAYSASSSATYLIVSSLGVTASSGSATYTRSQKASVTAVVRVAGSPVAGLNVTFTMTKSNGSAVTQTTTTASNGSALFTYLFNKRKDPLGTYQVRAVSTSNGLTGQGTTSFVVNR